MDGSDIQFADGEVQTIDTAAEPSMNGELQTAVPLEESLDPIPTSQS